MKINMEKLNQVLFKDLENLDDLIIRGVNIRKKINGIQSGNIFKDNKEQDWEIMIGIKTEYCFWNELIKAFLQEKQVDIVWASFFLEPDPISLLNNDNEFGDLCDPKSEGSQKMLKIIDEQTKIKLEKLREINPLPQVKNNGNKIKKENTNKIESIACVKSEKNGFKIIINKDYNNPIEVKKNKLNDSWNILYRIAEGEEISSNLIGSTKKLKNRLDYLNVNKKCKIYTRTGFQPTTLIETKNSFLSPAVKMEMINEATFKRRLNKT